MPVIHQFFPSASLILTLLQFLRPTFSQLYPLSNSSSAPTTTTSSLSPSSTPTVFPAYNFTYPDFPDQYNTGIQVSYKDTIDVAWVANGAQHTPVLQIQCWTRNDSSSFIYYEVPTSYTHTLVTPSSSSLASFPVPLSPYRKYSPCQLKLQDPEGSESVTGVAIFISQQTNASTQGVTWDVDNPAPKVAVDAGVATTQTGRAGMKHKAVGGGIWILVGALAAAMMLS